MSGVSVRTLHFYDEVGLLEARLPGAEWLPFLRRAAAESSDLVFSRAGFRVEADQGLLRRPDSRTVLETLDKTTEHLKEIKKMNDEEMFTGSSVAAGQERFSGRDTGRALSVLEFHWDAYRSAPVILTWPKVDRVVGASLWPMSAEVAVGQRVRGS
jgi:hypothetical protein